MDTGFRRYDRTSCQFVPRTYTCILKGDQIRRIGRKIHLTNFVLFVEVVVNSACIC